MIVQNLSNNLVWTVISSLFLLYQRQIHRPCSINEGTSFKVKEPWTDYAVVCIVKWFTATDFIINSTSKHTVGPFPFYGSELERTMALNERSNLTNLK